MQEACELLAVWRHGTTGGRAVRRGLIGGLLAVDGLLLVLGLRLLVLGRRLLVGDGRGLGVDGVDSGLGLLAGDGDLAELGLVGDGGVGHAGADEEDELDDGEDPVVLESETG